MSEYLISLTIDGEHYAYDYRTVTKDMTLLEFIRERAGLLGTKFMCLEGGCGSCTVVIKGNDTNSGRPIEYAANSCLVLANTLHNMNVTTIQGIGNRHIGYHPIQARLAQLNGSQCGYCSPGFVMNMYGLMKSNGSHLTSEEIENSFGGNVCRCTGYRSILDSMKSFASDSITNEENLIDIEDITKQNCSSKCDKNSKCWKNCKIIFGNKNIDLINDGYWYFPSNLNELFQIFEKIPNDEKYILIAGGTAHGVYRRPTDVKHFFDINGIQDLHSYSISDNMITIGANVSISKTMDILLEAANHPGFEYCLEIYNHYDLVAHKQVRNVGTLAGNLMTKYQYNDFPSDIFLTMETANAQLSIINGDGTTFSLSPLEFLNLDMHKRVIEHITLKPYPRNIFFFKSYKILPVAQNAKAIVNAGFLIEVDNTSSANPTVHSARICYGGISSNFVHASETEKYLIGRNLFQNDAITDTLYPELKTDYYLPDTSPEYRKLLACGLFYKFLLSIAPSSIVNSVNRSAGDILRRPLSHGTQSYQTKPTKYPLTQAVPKIEGIAQTSGEAHYSNDIPRYPNEVFAAFVTATNVNSILTQIDPTDALQIPGVIAFYSAKDIPGKNSFVNTDYFVLFVVDEPIFLPLNAEVQYYDQPIGMIVAETTKIAESAAKYVKVLYSHLTKKPVTPTIKEKFKLYPELANLEGKKAREYTPLSVEEMFNMTGKPSENKASDENYESSNIKSNPKDYEVEPIGLQLEDLSFDDVDLELNNFSGYLYLSGQYHYTMEPQTTVCIPIEEGFQIYSATQWMEGTQVTIARMLNLHQNAIQVEVRRVGGAYGGKISRNAQISCATALACYLLNRPVRFIMSIEAMMSCLGKRNGLHNSYHGTVDSRGRIVHLLSSYFSDCGCTINESPVNLFITKLARNCYSASIINWKIVGVPITTDAPSNTWMRAPGSLEAICMIENIMEHASRVSNIDPVDVRMIHIANDNPMKKLLPQFIQSTEYRQRKQALKKFNETNRWIKKGIAISLMQYDILYFFSFPVTVVIYEDDGTVAITHGGIEMGQGVNTKVAQTAAHIFQIPLENVKVFPSNTITGANAIVSGASVTSEMVCFATKKACENLLKRLVPVRATLPGASWSKIVKAAHVLSIKLIESDQATMQELKSYQIPGLACTEIELDVITGNHMVRRVDILEDTGESMSPLIDIGQVEGAFIQGLGYFTTEKLIYNSQTGQLVTNRTWTYKVPQCKDIPIDFRINFLKNSQNNNGVLRSKATGEPAICLSVSILFALRMALDSARKNAGIEENWFHMGAPFTTEDSALFSGTTVDMFKL
ncbi:xanthine dehydrogenase-like [Condylostylus longicornis]|uniref:xanthine dehydrogenase-like n=1 Tax=Condylostylus longicornis TaxID=2530218 RepID=UPI00244DD5E0|nr:xanthine dehydrogenase-like [Condylostylus longicornis]